MLTRPGQLSDAALVQALGAGWGITPVTMRYRAVGYGSHHWEVAAGRDLRWFVTVDDLTARLRSPADSLDAAYRRLCSALRTARAIYETGARFVVAPLRDFHAADRGGNNGPLAMALLRIWLFGVYLSSLESFYLDRDDPIWFTFLLAVFGLHYLARFRMRA